MCSCCWWIEELGRKRHWSACPHLLSKLKVAIKKTFGKYLGLVPFLRTDISLTPWFFAASNISRERPVESLVGQGSDWGRKQAYKRGYLSWFVRRYFSLLAWFYTFLKSFSRSLSCVRLPEGLPGRSIDQLTTIRVALQGLLVRKCIFPTERTDIFHGEYLCEDTERLRNGDIFIQTICFNLIIIIYRVKRRCAVKHGALWWRIMTSHPGLTHSAWHGLRGLVREKSRVLMDRLTN